MLLSSGGSVNAFNLLDLNSLRTGTGNFLCANREGFLRSGNLELIAYAAGSSVR